MAAISSGAIEVPVGLPGLASSTPRVAGVQAARTLAFASPAGVFVEVPMGGAPLLREMAAIDLTLHDGDLLPPTGLGFGVAPDQEFVRRFAKH
jgi:hypothetical protein